MSNFKPKERIEEARGALGLDRCFSCSDSPFSQFARAIQARKIPIDFGSAWRAFWRLIKAESPEPHHRRTVTIEFTRQLWPQPPPGSHPYWCYINTLIFYGKRWRKVWEQEIPEASFFFKGNYNWAVPSKFNLTGMKVEYDEDYGWLLKFKMSHQEAFKVYEFLFQHHPEFKVRYDENEGLKIEPKEVTSC